MPTWRCPHCGTPQTETARCWVCRRSSTACGTCRHFRQSVAAQLGYCGLDRGRSPLIGDEIRACWEAGAVSLATATPTSATTSTDGPTARVITLPGHAPGRLEFVEVGGRAAMAAERAATAPTGDPADDASPAPLSLEPGWNLWGDLDL